MDMSVYTDRPDFTRELRLHDGTVEVIRHCGKCLSVIPREYCLHCTDLDTVSIERREKERQLFEEGG